MDLTLLAPGARRNEGGGLVEFRQGYSQTNVDGQQMTINYHSQTDAEQIGSGMRSRSSRWWPIGSTRRWGGHRG
jgi:hypothetical protein